MPQTKRKAENIAQSSILLDFAKNLEDLPSNFTIDEASAIFGSNVDFSNVIMSNEDGVAALKSREARKERLRGILRRKKKSIEH
jgi:uncharacterized protein with ATP-grasp and redox domains